MLFDYWLRDWALPSHFAYSPVWSCSDYRCNHQTFVVTKQLSHKTFDFPRYEAPSSDFLPPSIILATLPLRVTLTLTRQKSHRVFLILFQSFFLTSSLLSKSLCDGYVELRSISVGSRVRIPPVPDILLMFRISKVKC